MSIKSIKFHIESKDYFGTIATILSLVKQNINKKELEKTNINILKNLEKDLIFLQKEFQIVKKNKYE
ncbi:MAG: hypothetical protein WCW61_02705 [Patescibacteria group bacterium]|jgi:hypothetical protein